MNKVITALIIFLGVFNISYAAELHCNIGAQGERFTGQYNIFKASTRSVFITDDGKSISYNPALCILIERPAKESLLLGSH